MTWKADELIKCLALLVNLEYLTLSAYARSTSPMAPGSKIEWYNLLFNNLYIR